MCRSSGDVFDFVGTTGAGQNFVHIRVSLGENAPTVQTLRKQPMSVDPMFKLATYSYNYGSLPAGENINITGDNLGVSTPSGYTPFAVRNVYTGSTLVAIRGVYGSASGTSTVLSIKNFTSSNATSTTGLVAGLTIVYVRSDLL